MSLSLPRWLIDEFDKYIKLMIYYDVLTMSIFNLLFVVDIVYFTL